MAVPRTLRVLPLLGVCSLASCGWLKDAWFPEEYDFDQDSGCISAGGNATPEPSLDDVQAAIAGNALRFAATRFAWRYEPFAAGWSSAGCVTTTGLDADVDGYPDVLAEGNVTLDSCTRSAFGRSLTASGTASVSDGDAGGGTAPFSHAASGTFEISGLAPDIANWAFDDAASVGTGFFRLLSTGSLGIHLSTSRDPEHDLPGERWDVDVTYVPVATWTPGTALAAGTMEVEGEWAAFFGGANAEGPVVTPTALTVDPDCPERITAGELRVQYSIYTTRIDDSCSEPNWAVWQLSVGWTGCGLVAIEHSFDHNSAFDPYP